MGQVSKSSNFMPTNYQILLLIKIYAFIFVGEKQLSGSVCSSSIGRFSGEIQSVGRPVGGGGGGGHSAADTGGPSLAGETSFTCDFMGV